MSKIIKSRHKPLVSVLISIYNEDENWIMESINSIINQTYKNLEIIIVNDNPENNNQLAIMKKLQKLDERIVTIVNDKNIGLALSMNKAFIESRGKFIARMDADDISDLKRFEKQVNILLNCDVDLVFTSSQTIDEAGVIIDQRSSVPTGNDNIKKVLPLSNIIAHPSVMLTRTSFENIGGYREFPIAQDYDLWLRYLTEGYTFHSINEPLIKYRQRQNSISIENKFKQVLTDEYEKELYYERIKTKTDRFSTTDLNDFYTKNGLYEEEVRDKFDCYNNYFYRGLKLLKERDIFSGIYLITRSCVKNVFIRKRLIRIIKYRMIIKKIRIGNSK